jgi:hypothetical protein
MMIDGTKVLFLRCYVNRVELILFGTALAARRSPGGSLKDGPCPFVGSHADYGEYASAHGVYDAGEALTEP